MLPALDKSSTVVLDALKGRTLHYLTKERFGLSCISFLSDHLRYLERMDEVFDASGSKEQQTSNQEQLF